jgi:hypothetical protein
MAVLVAGSLLGSAVNTVSMSWSKSMVGSSGRGVAASALEGGRGGKPAEAARLMLLLRDMGPPSAAAGAACCTAGRRSPAPSL